MSMACSVSVIVSTYNRAHLLGDAIAALVNQETDGLTYEVIIVDNNSTDTTRKVVQGFVELHPELVRYVFESKQGLSYGRNAGIAKAQGSILAFTDDDIRVEANWVSKVAAAFAAYPDASFVGGKVVGLWPGEQPAWASIRLSSLALTDYGNQVKTVDANYPICLIGANLACRREVMDRVGNFNPQAQRVKDGVGSMEDYEWQLRVMHAGMHGKYVPDLRVLSPVEDERHRKVYHRRWHFRHGRYRSLYRDPEFERASWRFFDTPAHLYRVTAEGFWKSVVLQMKSKRSDAFLTHCEALDNLGFIWQRWVARFGRHNVNAA